jgi:hypothetical protein
MEVGLEELEGFNRIHNVHDCVSKILLNPSNSSNPTSKNRLSKDGGNGNNRMATRLFLIDLSRFVASRLFHRH